MKKKIIGIAGVLVIGCIVGALYYKKILSINGFLAKQYEVKGVDVSHYQGEIDWKAFEEQGLSFGVIKATEGSTGVDDYFKKNWEEAAKTNFVVGAYHFFSFDSAASTQAENYIQTVGNLNGKLMPIVDFEFYGDKEKNPPEVETTKESLKTYLDLMEKEYGRKPMIYATMKAYRMYLKEDFKEYPLWIRNVYYSPNLELKDKWLFWQYTDRAVLEGYHGTEKYIDVNVFRGTKEELKGQSYYN